MAERLFSIAESYYENGEFESVNEYALKGIQNVIDMAERKGISLDFTGESIEGASRLGIESESDLEPTLEPISRASLSELEINKKKSIIETDRERDKEPEKELEKETEIETIKEVKFIEERAETEGALEVEPILEETPKKKKQKKKKSKVKKTESGGMKSTKADSKRAKTAAKLKTALKKIKDEISSTKDMGVPVDEAEALIQKAFRELKNGKLAKAKDIGLLAKNTLRTIRSDFIKQKALDIVKAAWKDLKDAKSRGDDVGQASKMLQEARNRIKAGEYEKAAELAMNALNQIE
jgi:hypothetical protein